MKYQDFSSDKNLVFSEDTIFILHTVKISLTDFLDKLFTYYFLKDNDKTLLIFSNSQLK